VRSTVILIVKESPEVLKGASHRNIEKTRLTWFRIYRCRSIEWNSEKNSRMWKLIYGKGCLKYFGQN